MSYGLIPAGGDKAQLQQQHRHDVMECNFIAYCSRDVSLKEF